jgi:hypothetical protein
MTAKEKSKDIVNKFNPFVYCYIGSSMLTNDVSDVAIKMNAKQCALIAVDEMLKTSWIDVWEKEYWQEVKQEILAL